MDKSMSTRDRVLCGTYGVIAIVALVATWYHNIAFFTAAKKPGALDFIRDAYANHAAGSLANDILMIAIAASIWMVVESRRLGIRYVWAYILGGALIAISVTFPLFLIGRQIRLSRITDSAQ